MSVRQALLAIGKGFTKYCVWSVAWQLKEDQRRENLDENNVSNQRLRKCNYKESQGNWSRLLKRVKIITFKYAKG